MKTMIINIFMLLLVFSMYGQESDKSVNIKIKRTYSNGKLTNESYYDKQGRLIKTARPDYSFYRGEGLNGKVYSISYSYDTLVDNYEYSKQPPQKKRYSYHVKNSIKSELELEEEYYYENGLLKKIKHFGIKTCNYCNRKEYFEYNKQGDLVKHKENGSKDIRYEHIYNSDSLVVQRAMYYGLSVKYDWSRTYEYNDFKQEEKVYFYNHDQRLTEITLYSYDEKQRLIKIEKTNLDVYTVEYQRRETKYITSYKYNNYDHIIEEHIFDDFMNKKGKEHVYQYEYEYY
jgi:hypothetical protein